MTTQKFVDENKTNTLKKGDEVKMINCGEATYYAGQTWICRTDSYKDKSGDDVVFLENFSGCFLSKCLQKIENATA
jgi:hypothetical protein